MPFLEEGHGYTLFPICLVEEKKLPEAVELLTCRSALKLPQPEAVEAASTPALKAALDSAGGHGTVALAVEEEFLRTAAMYIIIVRHKLMPHIIHVFNYTYRLLHLVCLCGFSQL